MKINLGPFTIAITRRPPPPLPPPPAKRQAADGLLMESEMLDLAVHLSPAAKQLLRMDLPPDSILCCRLILDPVKLVTCRPDDALRALRHVGYLTIECGLGRY